MSDWLDQNVRQFILDHQPVDLEMISFREAAVENHIPIIQPDVEHIIRWLIRSHDINSILEIGTAVGYSSICFARTMKQGKIATIERDESRYNEAVENIMRYGMNAVITPYLGEASEVIKTLKGKFDMIFLDASKSHYHEFFDDSVKLLNVNGIIVSDNVFFGGRVINGDTEKRYRTSTRNMREFVDYISNPPFDTVILPVGDGLSITTIAQGEFENE